MQRRAEGEAAAIRIATVDDVREAERGIRRHVSAAPLIRSHALERELGMPAERRIWLKDYGWTPVGSFKLLGALHWMARNLARIGDRPVVAHSSGNFASGIAFAGMRLGKRVIVVMPDTAARMKVELTRSFGAEIRTYDIARDHETGERDRLTREIADRDGAIQASPYDDADVIAGNGVGGLEIVNELRAQGRTASHLFCQVSGGGLMAGTRWRSRTAFRRPQSSASSRKAPRTSGNPSMRGGACASIARRASVTACSPTTSASTTGRSSGNTLRRPSPCRTGRRGKRCAGSTTGMACAPSLPARSRRRRC